MKNYRNDFMLTMLLAALAASGVVVRAVGADVASFDLRCNREQGMLVSSAGASTKDALLRYRGNTAGISADGAIGRNRYKFSDVAAQRDAIWGLRYAVRTGDADAAKKALVALGYAFSHQNEEGYFENGLGLTPTAAISADAFFLSAYGQFYYLARGTPFWKSMSPWFQARRPNLVAAMRWLAANKDELIRQDGQTANRLLFDAMAFVLNGQILGEASLVEIGRSFLGMATSMQHAEGYFLEKGGYDSSYQAVSLLNLAALVEYSTDATLAGQADAAGRRGLRWLRARIGKDGAVSIEGNTRTGAGQETFFGRPKDVNYPEVIYALLQWTALGEGDNLAQAQAVADYLRTLLKAR